MWLTGRHNPISNFCDATLSGTDDPGYTLCRPVKNDLRNLEEKKVEMAGTYPENVGRFGCNEWHFI